MDFRELKIEDRRQIIDAVQSWQAWFKPKTATPPALRRASTGRLRVA